MIGERIIGIGDPVEVHFCTPTGDSWKPATVCSLNQSKIGCAFASGLRVELPRHSKHWRKT